MDTKKYGGGEYDVDDEECSLMKKESRIINRIAGSEEEKVIRIDDEQIGEIKKEIKKSGRNFFEKINDELNDIFDDYILTIMNPFNPTSAIVELTTRCNYRCITCKGSPYKAEYIKNALDMSEEVLSEIIKRLPRFRRVHLCGEGESLILKDFLDIWDRMPQDKIYTLSTNGYELTENIAQKFIERRLQTLYVSIDSINPPCIRKNTQCRIKPCSI